MNPQAPNHIDNEGLNINVSPNQKHQFEVKNNQFYGE